MVGVFHRRFAGREKMTPVGASGEKLIFAFPSKLRGEAFAGKAKKGPFMGHHENFLLDHGP